MGAVCTDTGVNSRTCACDVGLSGVATVTDVADDADIASLFSGTCVGMHENLIYSWIVRVLMDYDVASMFRTHSR